ncbi:MAG: serpin family protein [Lachnospiraceae bacterium]|nr:serpin family protein [Lachnospiraceae bacterium]
MKRLICVVLIIALACSTLTGCASRTAMAKDNVLIGTIGEKTGGDDENTRQENEAGKEDLAVAADESEFAKVSGKTMKLSKKSRMDTEQLTEGYNYFAMRALKTALKTDGKPGENLMISPASLMFALDMAAMGAKGSTYKQIAKLFSPDGVKSYASKRDIVLFSKQYREMLEKSGLMDIANSIWINENNLVENNVRINEKYLNLLRKHYKAAAASLKFDNAAAEQINEWVSNKTKGMIKKAVDDLSDDSIMLIINAMAFEGVWKKKYEDYQINENGIFTNSNGKEEKAKMLSSEESWYLQGYGAQGFLKYYEGDKYAFMAILPDDEKISINDFVMGLDNDAFEKFYASRTSAEVDTMTPAFSFDFNINMNKMLKSMGMTKAFDKNADFFSMLDPETVNPDLLLYIGSVIQKTHIELDENGTKAAAVTIIDFKCETTSVREPEPRKRVILDRPFAFAIVDTESGTPVFAGVVNSVK